MDTTLAPRTKQEFKDRELHTGMMALAIKGLKMIHDAEEYIRNSELKRCRFILYKERAGKGILFEGNFYKPSEGIYKTNMILFRDGFPKKINKKAILYKEAISTQGYEKIDKGIFREKSISFTAFVLSFKGNKYSNIFLLKQFKKSNNTLWVQNRTYTKA